ncbi:MAG: PIG-L family deacetylase [Acidobacteria bacterium]|nr:PIG-L family deacetylase [Acidobacteriota bacterium]
MTRRRLPTEQELMPYATSAPPGARWLFLSPHPDDEVFGAGATLAIAARRGVDVSLVVVTDGGAQGDPMTREHEACAAAEALGLRAPVFWRFPDRGLDPADVSLRRRVDDAITKTGADTIFVTSPIDLHPDHRALARAVQGVLRRRLLWGWRGGSPQWVVAYEVATPILPNLLVAVDPVIEVRRRAASMYASQLGFRGYDRAMEAFGTLRALTLERVEQAEAFFVLPARNVARLSASRWAALMGSPRGMRWTVVG